MIHNRTATILPRLCEAIDLSSTTCRDFLIVPKFEKQVRRDIRVPVGSCLAHHVSSTNKQLIEKLDNVSLTAKDGLSISSNGHPQKNYHRKHSSNSVFPVNPVWITRFGWESVKMLISLASAAESLYNIARNTRVSNPQIDFGGCYSLLLLQLHVRNGSP